MKVTRFHATADGGSRFQEVEIPITEPRPDQFGHTILQSNSWASPSIRFVELPVGQDQSWHHAPARQIVVVLSGKIEVGTSDDQKRQCNCPTVSIAIAGHRKYVGLS
jgi:quercetin dioxygenase-like cupin family protein